MSNAMFIPDPGSCWPNIIEIVMYELSLVVGVVSELEKCVTSYKVRHGYEPHLGVKLY